SLCFCASAPNPILHSFPTRRSSDLRAAPTAVIAHHCRKMEGVGRPSVASIKDSIQQGSFRVFGSGAIETTFPFPESIRVSVLKLALLDGGVHFIGRPVPSDLDLGWDD